MIVIKSTPHHINEPLKYNPLEAKFFSKNILAITAVGSIFIVVVYEGSHFWLCLNKGFYPNVIGDVGDYLYTIDKARLLEEGEGVLLVAE
jgi:hypothetical protein